MQCGDSSTSFSRVGVYIEDGGDRRLWKSSAPTRREIRLASSTPHVCSVRPRTLPTAITFFSRHRFLCSACLFLLLSLFSSLGVPVLRAVPYRAVLSSAQGFFLFLMRVLSSPLRHLITTLDGGGGRSEIPRAHWARPKLSFPPPFVYTCLRFRCRFSQALAGS